MYSSQLATPGPQGSHNRVQFFLGNTHRRVSGVKMYAQSGELLCQRADLLDSVSSAKFTLCIMASREPREDAASLRETGTRAAGDSCRPNLS